MQPSDRAPAAGGREGPARPDDPLIGALQSFYRAYQKSTIYPTGHPSVPEAIQQAIDRFRAALAERRSLLLGISRDHFILDGRRLAESTGTLRSLALLLHEIDVAAIEFLPGLGSEELVKLVEHLGRARRLGTRGAALAAAAQEDGIEHLKLVPIDYRALSFGEGAQRRADEGSWDVWGEMSRILTDPASYESGTAVEDFAKQVSTEIHRREGTGVGDLRGELRRQVTHLRELPTDQRALARRRLSGFVRALNPELRRNLLRVDPHGTGESVAIMVELADELPGAELIEALQSVDRAGNSMPEELGILLTKLVRISHSRPAQASRLEETLARWGLSPDVLESGSISLNSAMEEVFQRRTEQDYNPEEYRSLLTRLSREDLAQPTAIASGGASEPPPASAARYRDPHDAIDVRLHATEIGVQLLSRAGGGGLRTGVFAYVGAQTDLLLEHGKLAAVHEATVAARADKLLATTPESARTAASGYLADFESPERIEVILNDACRGAELAVEALHLLELGGMTALDAAIDRLGGDSSPAVDAALRRFVASSSTESWTRLVTERSKQGWTRLKPLFPLLRSTPPTCAVPLLQKLFEHEAPEVRRESLVALCEIDRSAPPEQYPRRGLGDSSLQVLKVAVQRLALLDRAEAQELLVAFVSGDLRGASSRFEARRLAVAALLERGTAAQERLADALRSLCSRLAPRQARLARELARALGERSDAGGVKEALAAWRFSPGRLVSGLLAAVGR